MSNEIRATGNMQVSSNGFTVTNNTTATVSMTGSEYIGNVQSIGTSYESLTMGDLSDIRYLSMTNISTGSVVVAVVGSAETASFATLQPDDVLLLPPSASFTKYVLKATLVNSDVQVVMAES